MKAVWSGLLVAFSLYSAVPVPQVPWEKATMRWALSFLPLVGIVIAAAEWVWYAFCAGLRAVSLFYAVGAALLPLVLSGGIHLDGLCDTCDALCSFGDREKRLAILKDSHVGAFGPLWLIAFLLAEVGCFAQIYVTPFFLPLALVGFALARALGGAKIVRVPCAKDSGLARMFADNSDKTVVAVTLALEALALAALLFLRFPSGGSKTVCTYLALLLLWYAAHTSLCKKTFGGITGDLAGFFISTSELLALVCAACGGLLL